MSVNELHDFVAARWRRSVPGSSQAGLVKALRLNVRQVVRRLVEDAQMEVRLFHYGRVQLNLSPIIRQRHCCLAHTHVGLSEVDFCSPRVQLLAGPSSFQCRATAHLRTAYQLRVRQSPVLSMCRAPCTGGAGAAVQGRASGAAVPAGARRDGAHGPRCGAKHPPPHGGRPRSAPLPTRCTHCSPAIVESSVRC